jgi:hypothetical protein
MRHARTTICAPQLAIAGQAAAVQNGGRRAFLRTVPVTQRHIADRHHLQADLQFSVAWTALLEAHGLLVEVLAEAASGGGTGTSCWSRRPICGMSERSYRQGIPHIYSERCDSLGGQRPSGRILPYV